jgi:MFS family permease
MASRRSGRGLDWLNFFVANVQTGFGPFIAVYLTTEAWTQAEIGQALSLGTIAVMLSQLPAGAFVDRLRDKRLVAAGAGIAVAASAVLFAAVPDRPAVMLAEVLHSVASALLGPAIAAISLGLAGYGGLGLRLGRNARFASLGNGSAALVLGLCGAYVSSRAVFWLTAILMLPALFALSQVQAAEFRTQVADPAAGQGAASLLLDTFALLSDRHVLAFAGCVVLFHLANAALLPLVASDVTREAGDMANLFIAISIVLPQAVVTLISPWVGRAADRRARRLVLTLGFAAVPLRAALFALVIDRPELLVAAQVLDGVSAAVFGVTVPVVAADLTRHSNQFNLCMGVFGLASAAGATASTFLAGRIADAASETTALLALAGCGILAALAVLLASGRRHPHALPLDVAVEPAS